MDTAVQPPPPAPSADVANSPIGVVPQGRRRAGPSESAAQREERYKLLFKYLEQRYGPDEFQLNKFLEFFTALRRAQGGDFFLSDNFHQALLPNAYSEADLLYTAYCELGEPESTAEKATFKTGNGSLNVRHSGVEFVSNQDSSGKKAPFTEENAYAMILATITNRMMGPGNTIKLEGGTKREREILASAIDSFNETQPYHLRIHIENGKKIRKVEIKKSFTDYMNRTEKAKLVDFESMVAETRQANAQPPPAPVTPPPATPSPAASDILSAGWSDNFLGALKKTVNPNNSDNNSLEALRTAYSTLVKDGFSDLVAVNDFKKIWGAIPVIQHKDSSGRTSLRPAAEDEQFNAMMWVITKVASENGKYPVFLNENGHSPRATRLDAKELIENTGETFTAVFNKSSGQKNTCAINVMLSSFVSYDEQTGHYMLMSKGCTQVDIVVPVQQPAP